MIHARSARTLSTRITLLTAGVAGATFLLPPSEARGADPAPVPRFQVDPVSDIVLTAGAAGVAGLMDMVLSTGEIVPTTPGSTSHLLSIDRVAVTQTVDPHAATYSNIGLGVALGFAALDPVLTGLRTGWDATLVDFTMYAESLALTLAITDVIKVAVRRPRPIDYMNCEGGPSTGPLTRACSSTDLQLSFFSGHASTVAAVSATATYLAFARSPDSPRPWLTLGAGLALTTFVSVERVRAGAHFPTDVIAGSLAGAAIGILVPHLHRHPFGSVWVGLAPVEGGGVADVHGAF
jgi:undecaprenyl-diphosphatase